MTVFLSGDRWGLVIELPCSIELRLTLRSLVSVRYQRYPGDIFLCCDGSYWIWLSTHGYVQRRWWPQFMRKILRCGGFPWPHENWSHKGHTEFVQQKDVSSSIEVRKYYGKVAQPQRKRIKPKETGVYGEIRQSWANRRLPERKCPALSTTNARLLVVRSDEGMAPFDVYERILEKHSRSSRSTNNRRGDRHRY